MLKHPTKHKIEIPSSQFDAIASGRLTFLLEQYTRRAYERTGRFYNIGDMLIITDAADETRTMTRHVSYVMWDHAPFVTGIASGFCIIGLKEMKLEFCEEPTCPAS